MTTYTLHSIKELAKKETCLDEETEDEREILEIRLEKDERGLGLTVAGYICEKGDLSNDLTFHFLFHCYRRERAEIC